MESCGQDNSPLVNSDLNPLNTVRQTDDGNRAGLVLGGLRSRREFRRMRRIAAAKGARYQWVIFRPDREALDVLHEFLSRGRLTLEVGIAATLQDAGAAFDHVARRKAGRAALRLLE